jgi:hypothetical protein
MAYSRTTALLILAITTLISLWLNGGVMHILVPDIVGLSAVVFKTVITHGNSTMFYCDQNSKHPSCCSPEHCKVVQKSTIYSECCDNMILPTTVPSTTNPPPGIQYYFPPRKLRLPPTPRYKYKKPIQREWNRSIRKAQLFPILITATPRSGTVFVQRLLKRLGLDVSNDSTMPRTDGMVSWMHIFNDDKYFGAVNLKGSKFRAVWHQVRDPLKCLTSMAFTEPLDDRNSTKNPAVYVQFLQRHIQLTERQDLMTKLQQQQPNTELLLPQTHNNQTVVDATKIQEEFLIYRGMEFYTQWHNFLLTLEIPRLRLEDLTESHNLTVLDRIFASAGKSKPPDHGVAMKLIAKGRRRHRHLTEKSTDHKKAHTNHREHRQTLEWDELCHVSVSLTKEFLQVSRKLGYYSDKQDVC